MATNKGRRIPAVEPEKYTTEQRRAADAFEAARGRPVSGPFETMIHSPSLMTPTRIMGEYLRYQSALGNTLSELVILITAREWSQDFEWQVHYPIAIKSGISRETADAISDGRRPVGMSEEESIVYDFSMELHRNRRVSDVTFERVRERFGYRGVVDLTGINGYYAFLAMQLNVARLPVADDADRLPRFPDPA